MLSYERPIVEKITTRLDGPRQLIEVVTGPRQTGKTTAIKQALEKQALPYRVAAADFVAQRSVDWLMSQWQMARALIKDTSPSAILVLDEVQNVEQWSAAVKGLWDEDTWSGTDLRVLISGSSALLLQKGLAESLAGRFETIQSTHWSLGEMRAAFGYSPDDFLIFGGFPGAAPLRKDVERWTAYMQDAIIETTLSKDVLQMEAVRKPALLRKLLILGSQYSAREVSYRNLLGQLDDKGNTDTIAHYLELLNTAGLLRGLSKYDAKELETRRSSPRLMVYDTALMSAVAQDSFGRLLGDPALRGHLVESAVGAYLIARGKEERFDVFWWRDGTDEVDFVIQKGSKLTAIEVKSGRKASGSGGLNEFLRRYPHAKPLVVGDRNTPLEDFLSGGVELL
jgi:predicted AAA+ superfamily ATPase